jgi:hypothetical protein
MSVSSIFNGGTWISTIWDAGVQATSSTGMMGALQNASSRNNKPGSLKSYLDNSSNAGVALASISQTGTTNATALAIEAGDLAREKLIAERMAAAQKRNVPMIPAAPLGDTMIFFDNGSTLDTQKNVLTMADGRKFDSITGAEWADPASIIQMGNGSYLNTATSILTMANGTKINTITGLVV